VAEYKEKNRHGVADYEERTERFRSGAFREAVSLVP
jgi:hypothetical protein